MNTSKNNNDMTDDLVVIGLVIIGLPIVMKILTSFLVEKFEIVKTFLIENHITVEKPLLKIFNTNNTEYGLDLIRIIFITCVLVFLAILANKIRNRFKSEQEQ